MSEFELFQAALEIDDPVARQQFLASSCHSDAALLSRVEALLTSHEGQSRFLQIPVVEQIVDVSDRGAVATMVVGSGSTHDDEPDATAVHVCGAATTTELSDEADDEIPLGYLEPSSKPDSLGRLGHYEVLEVVGRGAFGTVLRAFDEKLHRVVAIKVMAPELASTSPARKRFLREAQASAAIRHEHVVSIYAVEEKPIPYLVMEYIPGQTLQQRLDERGPLEFLSVLRLGRQIAEGLAAAHAINLIHRDIKPGNILLETGVQERVKITDFGLARTVDDASLTQSGMIAGTPMYMAPEQALGKKLDQRADLFSFGSVLYQMVSGRPPFRAPTALAVIKRVAEEAPRPISEIIPEAPQWLCDIIAKLHAKNPDDRYQTARDVADVLADCEAQLKANAKLQDFSRIPQSKPAKSAQWPLFTAGSVLGAMVLFGLIFITLTNKDGTKTTLKVPEGSNAPVDAGKDGRVDVAGTAPTASPPSSQTSLPDRPIEAQSPDQNWVQLFNGQDLTGWKTQPGAPGHWEVKDGVLMGSQRPSVLFSERGDYANFHFRAEVKINQGGDSGIIFRTGFANPPGKEAWPLGPIGGYEAEIHKQPTYSRRTGSVLSLRRDAPVFLSKMNDDSLTRPDEWFTLEVIAEQNRFITKVNGVVAANCSDPLNGDISGHLALQVRSAQTIVQFRKIEIRELPPSQSLSEGFVSLFNGQDLKGWKTTAELPGQWEVKDGILMGSSRQSYLYSERSDFANFHLRMETKNNGLGGSGLYLHAPFALRHGPRAGQTQPAGGYDVNLFSRPVPLGTITEIVKGAPQRILCRAVDNTSYRPGEWFTVEVIANENHFITKVNGQETVNCRDSASRYATGHLALALYDSQTVVQFRKIEIKELPPPAPSSAPAPQPQFYASEEWIDVLPLIDPSLDKWNMRLTGQNDWRIEQGELLVGSADEKPCKLLFPLDADFFPSFECELEVTRRAGDHGFNFNFPTANGDTPLSFDFPTKHGVFVRHAKSGVMLISEAPVFETGKRTTVRIEVRRQQAGDKISVWCNDATVGTWTGDRNELASGNNEGYEHRRRLSFFMHGGGNEFVFHRIRVRPLDGGNAESLRPVYGSPRLASPPLAIVPFDAEQALAHQEAWAKHLGVPVVYTNSIGMKFRLIPTGEFSMGMTREDSEAIAHRDDSHEHAKLMARSSSPPHRVRLTQPIYLGVHEVTQQQYESVVGSNPSYFSASGDGRELVKEDASQQHPVDSASFVNAIEFCVKLSEREHLKPAFSIVSDEITAITGNGYRLPTEAEWEFACRAGTQTAWFCGNQELAVSSVAWHGGNSGERTHPVGQLRENPFGLFDVHGNVWEWCQDWWDEKAYAQRAQDIATNPQGPDAGSARVMRGGDWISNSSIVRSAMRNHAAAGYQNHTIGFRVLVSVDAVKAAVANPQAIANEPKLPSTYTNNR